MRGGQHHHRQRRIALLLLRHRDADRGVRIDEMAGLALHGARWSAATSSSSARSAVNSGADLRQRARRQREAARLRQRSHERAHGAGVAAAGVEQQPLEIRRDLDVHRRRRRRHHVAQFVGAGRERPRQDVVDVGGDHQPVDRQAYALRHVAGIDVAEIAGRHGEGHFAVRRAERHRGGEVIDRLRHDPRPVDRVDAGQAHAVAKGARD